MIVEEENRFTEFLNFDADMENTREGQVIEINEIRHIELALLSSPSNR